MNKIKLVVLIILLVSIIDDLYAQESDFTFAFNLANIGWGMNLSSDLEESNITFNLLNLYVEHKKTNIGIEISPFHIWNGDFYFINTQLYYNFFNLWKNDSYAEDNGRGSTYGLIGPFFSLNYLRIGNNGSFNPSDIQINIGLRGLAMFDFSVFWEGSVPIGLQIANIELGYRFNDFEANNHSFYINFSTDVLVIVYIIKIFTEISK
jgi:hypothetical protein